MKTIRMFNGHEAKIEGKTGAMNVQVQIDGLQNKVSIFADSVFVYAGNMVFDIDFRTGKIEAKEREAPNSEYKQIF